MAAELSLIMVYPFNYFIGYTTFYSNKLIQRIITTLSGRTVYYLSMEQCWSQFGLVESPSVSLHQGRSGECSDLVGIALDWRSKGC